MTDDDDEWRLVQWNVTDCRSLSLPLALQQPRNDFISMRTRADTLRPRSQKGKVIKKDGKSLSMLSFLINIFHDQTLYHLAWNNINCIHSICPPVCLVLRTANVKIQSFYWLLVVWEKVIRTTIVCQWWVRALIRPYDVVSIFQWCIPLRSVCLYLYFMTTIPCYNNQPICRPFVVLNDWYDTLATMDDINHIKQCQ